MHYKIFIHFSSLALFHVNVWLIHSERKMDIRDDTKSKLKKFNPTVVKLQEAL